MVGKIKFITIECVYKARTAAAVLITYKDEDIWLPRSGISFRSDERVDAAKRGEEMQLSIADWLAYKTGIA